MRSLADVVSGAGLATYAEVALVLFVLTFIALGLRVLLSADYDVSGAQLPFDVDAPDGPAARESPAQSSAHATTGAVHGKP